MVQKSVDNFYKIGGTLLLISGIIILFFTLDKLP